MSISSILKVNKFIPNLFGLQYVIKAAICEAIEVDS